MDQENQAVATIDFDNSALTALIHKVGQGDSTAFSTLYDTTSSLIFGLILRIMKERAAAEEVLTDVYTEVWKKSASYDPDKFMPLEWILTIARTRAVTKLDGSKENRKRTVPEAGEPGPEMTVAPAMQNHARSSIESLTPSQKEILDWVFHTGLSCSEVATQSGKPLGAVKIHTRIGMSKLYDLFRPLYERETGSENAKGGHTIES